MNKRVLILLLFISFFGQTLLAACVKTEHKTTPVAVDGIIDLREWSFKDKGPVSLSGEWRFYWKKLLAPDTGFNSASPLDYDLAKVPGAWNGLEIDGKKIPGHGFGTYRLRILITPQNEPLAFKFLDMATAFQVFANGRPIFSSGQVGETPQTSIPRLKPGLVEIEGHPATIDLLVHVSNFDHWQGGAWESIRLGAARDITAQYAKNMFVNLFLLGAVVIMGLYHLGLFNNRKTDRSTVYFGIFCLLIAVRILTSGERYILHIIPDLQYDYLQKLVYISFYLSIAVFTLYVKNLFPDEFSKKIAAVAKYVTIILSVFALVTPTRVFSLTMPGAQIFALLLFLYGVKAALSAVLHDRDGAKVFLAGFIVFFAAAVNDILYTRQIIDTGHVFQLGFFIFILAQAYIISMRFSKAYALIENQSNELQAINDGYEKEIKWRGEAETKLKESERRYRLLAENVSDIIWILDIETMRFVYTSPSVEKIRGFTPEECLALSLEETLSPDSLARVTDILEQELRNDRQYDVDKQRSRTIEVEHALKGGGYAWAEITVTFMRDRQGNPNAVLGVSRDIETRKRVEAEIIESEKKYRNLFENGSDLLCIHDLAGNLLETNIPFKTEYGWSQEDLEHLNIKDVIPEHLRSEFDQYIDLILANGEAEGTMKSRTKSGEYVILEYRNKLIHDATGRPVAVQGAARDITARYHAQKALQESEEKYRNLVRHAPAGIYEFDMEKLKFISVNDILCEYMAYTENEFLTMSPFDLVAEESREYIAKTIEDVFHNHPNELAIEYKARSKDHREFSVLANIRIFYEDGEPKRAMAIVHDLTEIRRAEEEKRKLESQLQNAKKFEALGTLAGGVAHDLNNILGGLVTYPDFLLHMLEKDSPLRKPLENIKKSGQKAGEIVRDLLTLTRRGVESREVININVVIKDFLDSPEFQKIMSDKKGIQVETNLEEGLLNSVGSDYQLSKAVMNLFANAVDAMPSGGTAAISTTNLYLDKNYQGFEEIPEGEYTVIEISDLGIGISETDLENIFEPFYTKKVMGRSGTGLGMTVVRGTVKDHGGYIDVQSKEGVGTTFQLYIPATRQEEKIRETVHIDDYLGQGESILVIDDSEEQRDLARGMMQRIGYQVDTASSGEEAVEMVKSKVYDLLILDMIMDPGMNGMQTYKNIIQIAPNQKAVIASGFAENELVHEAQRLGAGQYIRKPYTLEIIGLAVRSELDRNN